MEEVQKITVTTKKQLIAGVGCAIDFPGITKIVLQRKMARPFTDLNLLSNLRLV